MTSTLARDWWLPALCGLFSAAYAVTNLIGQSEDGSLGVREFLGHGTVVLLGQFALVAGLASIGAGIVRRSWLLALNGAALIGYAWIHFFWSRGSLRFAPVAVLFVVMAISVGIVEVAAPGPHRWILKLPGIACLGYALGFVLLGLQWIRLEPVWFLVWISSYFAFSALSMLVLAGRAV
ncbi:MAG TPA: hypothetical protein VMT15_02760 [Bryobacteraceae bacterium]|nr:hypothetical protein [Bryobacteraceae bacterium]